MLSLQVVTTFFGLAVVLSLAPGPDNLFVLAQSMAHGARSGLWVVLGLCSGLVVHTLAVALGLAALMAASPWALRLVQTLGAAYLLYLAWGAWRAGASRPGQAVAQTGMRLWRRGLFMNVTNPKVVLFFLALLPQFVQPDAAPAGQIVALGAVFMVAALLVFGSISFFAGYLGDALRRHANAQKWLNRASAGVFVALAARLLMPL